MKNCLIFVLAKCTNYLMQLSDQMIIIDYFFALDHCRTRQYLAIIKSIASVLFSKYSSIGQISNQ